MVFASPLGAVDPVHHRWWAAG